MFPANSVPVLWESISHISPALLCQSVNTCVSGQISGCICKYKSDIAQFFSSWLCNHIPPVWCVPGYRMARRLWYVLYWNANSWLGEQKRKWGNDSLEEWWVLCTASWLHWNPIFRGEWLLNPRWWGLVSAPQCGKTSGEKCTDSPKSDSACTGICHISPALRRGLGRDKETNKTQEETCFCLHIAVYRIVYVN